MQQNIEISIIIPVYNTQEYLKRCLNSIINQSYKVSYEIICIDDGSTDKSVDILNQYKSKYPDNFKILYQKHSGQAEARNLGIKSAAGNFIMFIDSDDFIAENLLKECSNKLKIYILSIPFIKTIKKAKKTYIKLFGFIPLLKIKNSQ